MQALGLIEVIGYITAIEAADAALKSADIKLIGISKVGSGIMTVMFYGDVSATKSAVENGSMAAERIGKIRSVHVIPRADSSLDKMLPNMGGNNTNQKEQSEAEFKAQKSSDAQMEAKREAVDLYDDAKTAIVYNESQPFSADELMKKTNSELKNMAYGIGISEDAVRNVRKSDLVEMIIGGMSNA